MEKTTQGGSEMRRAAILGLWASLVITWSVVRQTVHATDSDSIDLAFVVGTCWPQAYESDPEARMERLLIDSNLLNQVDEAVKKYHQQTK
jgi:hypothetical protein